ncbi:MAG: hypothetical protein L0Y68_01530 [Candidatus Dadabacteria bacterium]|nr:hypothetical protein [Candidatus Dadabacteria bacterium]
MDSLFTIFVVQVIIWTLLFVLICYMTRKNAHLKKEIKLLKDARNSSSNRGVETLGSHSEKKEAN